MTEPKEQMRIICKGVDTLVNKEELLIKIERSYKEGRPLVVKLGLDPSAPDIHLGHTVVLRKVRQMQDLGHKAIIVIGDFTGKIGDPTGKAKGRAALSEEQVKENARTYCEQIFKVLDKEKTEIRFNSEWLSVLNFEEIVRLAATTTVARILERDDFQNRYRNQTPIGIHEFFYPLMQAYDSVHIQADIELGGTDQTFNVLMGRSLQKSWGQEQQIAMFLPILVGLDGTEKMSKSLGNYIGVSEPAEIMFKKVMEIPDSLIIKYFELITDEHPDKIDDIKKQLEEGKNPRDIKLQLAEIITRLYHGDKNTEEAKEYFYTAFSKKAIPANIPELVVELGNTIIEDVVPKLVLMNMVESKSDFIRLVKQGGVQLAGVKLGQNDLKSAPENGQVMKIGKKKFIRFILKENGLHSE